MAMRKQTTFSIKILLLISLWAIRPLGHEGLSFLAYAVDEGPLQTAEPALPKNETEMKEVESAKMVSPVSGTILTSTNVTFVWNLGVGIESVYLKVGSKPGAEDLYGAAQGDRKSITVFNVPQNGKPIYVQLRAKVRDGNSYLYEHYIYQTIAEGIRGGVIDIDGHPLQGVEIMVESNGQLIEKVITDEDGRYETQYLAEGAYNFIPAFVNYGFTPESVGLDVKSGKPNPEISFSAFRKPSVDGFVVDKVSGQALPDMDIHIEQNGKVIETVKTNGQGFYQLDLPVGSFTVVPSSTSYVFSPAQAGIDVVSGKDLSELNFEAVEPSQLLTPEEGNILTSSELTLTWSKGGHVSDYRLYVGTQQGQWDIYPEMDKMNILKTGMEYYPESDLSELTKTISGIPQKGASIAVRLMSRIDGRWYTKDYSFLVVEPAVMLSPADGAILKTSSVTFSWSEGRGFAEYWLVVGTGLGREDVYSASAEKETSVTVKRIPINGKKIYVQLQAILKNDAGTVVENYTYLTADRESSAKDAKAVVLASASSSSTKTSKVFTKSNAIDVGEMATSIRPTDAIEEAERLESTGPADTESSDTTESTDTTAPVNHADKAEPVADTTAATDTTDYSAKSEDKPIVKNIEIISPVEHADKAKPTADTTVVTDTTDHSAKFEDKPIVKKIEIISPLEHADKAEPVADTTVAPNPDTTPAQPGPSDPTDTTDVPPEDSPAPDDKPIGKKAEITSPLNHSTIFSSNLVLFWDEGVAVDEYWLMVGTSKGESDLFSKKVGTDQSIVVNKILQTGEPFYVRLLSLVNGVWEFADYQYQFSKPAQLISPVQETVLTESRVTFQWDQGVGIAEYWLSAGTSSGGQDLYSASQGKNLSAEINDIPQDGKLVYVQLRSRSSPNNEWMDMDYIFETEFDVKPAVMISPVNGAVLKESEVKFIWDAGIGIKEVWLAVGTSPDAEDIYSTSQGTDTSVLVQHIPQNGKSIYVQLRSRSKANDQWITQNYSYQTVLVAYPAEMIEPVDGAILTESTVDFSWSKGKNVTEYWLSVGSGKGSGDIYSASQQLKQSATVKKLPINWDPLYVRLRSQINGEWIDRDYVYQTQGKPIAAGIISPEDGSTIKTESVTFSWDAGKGITEYWLAIGTKKNKEDIYSASQDMKTSVTVSDIPKLGDTIYVQLRSKSQVNGEWLKQNYTYKTDFAVQPAEIISPENGSILATADVTFSWSAGKEITQYWLAVGTSEGAEDIYSESQKLNQSVTVAGIPLNGEPLYVQLRSKSKVDKEWLIKNYKYEVALVAQPAVMISPLDGTTLKETDVSFLWSQGEQVSEYWLAIGRSHGAEDIYSHSQKQNVSVTVKKVPLTWEPVYVQLRSKIHNVWTQWEYVYPTQGKPVAAQITGPSTDTLLESTNVTFSWDQGKGIKEYWLAIGTKKQEADVYSASQGNRTTVTIYNIPQNGKPIYVELRSIPQEDGPALVNKYTYETEGDEQYAAERKIVSDEPVSHGLFGTTVDLENDNLLIGASKDANKEGDDVIYTYVNEKDDWILDNKFYDKDVDQPSTPKRMVSDGTTLVVEGQSFKKEDTMYHIFIRGSHGWEIDADIKVGYNSEITLSKNIVVFGSKDSIQIYRKSSKKWEREAFDFYDIDLTQGVSIDLDGDVLVIGTQAANTTGVAQKGMVYVYERKNKNQWVRAATLDQSFAVGRGLSVDLNANTIVVGVTGLTPCDQGAVTVFVKTNEKWGLDQNILEGKKNANRVYVGPLAIGNGRVAFHAQSNTCVDEIVPENAIVVYEKSPKDPWKQAYKLQPTDYILTLDAKKRLITNGFGDALAIDKDTVVVGAPRDHLSNTDSENGAVYVYTLGQ